MEIYQYIQFLEADRQKSRSLVKRLREENSWLRDELNVSQDKGKKAEEELIDLKSEVEHLRYMHSLKQFDDNNKELDFDSGRGTDIFDATGRSPSHTKTLQELGFDEEDDAPAQPMSTSSSNSIATRTSQNDLLGGAGQSISRSLNAYDDVPAHLKTVHSLASQLRFSFH